MSIHITTPMPSAEEVADGLGLSKERRKFLSDLALTAKAKAKTKHVIRKVHHETSAAKSAAGQKRLLKKAS